MSDKAMEVLDNMDTGVLDFSGLDLRSLPDIKREASDRLGELAELTELGACV